MTKNPIFNAIAASLYIVFISLIMNFGSKYAPKDQSFLAPIAVVSLFTLSAAIMGYLFGYQPIQLFLDGEKKKAVKIFLKTVLVFAIFTVCELGLLFSGIIK